MGQRINIQYSVDIDELDKEVARLMEDAHARHSSLQEVSNNGGAPTLSNETLETIDNFRIQMAAIDHQLNDVANIISGYLHYKAQESMAQHVPDQNSNPLRGNELDGKLEDFKALMDASENEVANQGK